MRALQDHPGHYFHSDDVACLRFNEAHGDAPTTIQAHVIGRGLQAPGGTVPVGLADCELLAVGDFGESRPCGSSTRWTGSSHRFGIYTVQSRLDRNRILIFRTDGSGARFYLVDETDALATWATLTSALTPAVLWNLCMTLTETYHQARRTEQREQHYLFAMGRLRKRKKGGAVHVEVLPEVAAKA